MPTSIHHGMVDLVRRDGVAPVWCDGHELLRRIFITVRDRHWLEVAPTHWDSAIDEARRTATLTARHTSDQVDFEWQGTLHVSDDLRNLRFAFAGKVLRDTEVCRLGLVVLHPVESLIGSRLTAMCPQAEHSLTVPDTLSAQPIVNGIPAAMTEPFSELRIERADFGRLELRFGGDLFEIEDQRNWGDASFKTYCTPLRLGFPRVVKAGATIAHNVEVRFVPAPARQTSRIFAPARGFGSASPGIFPRIGREWCRPSAAGRPDEEEPDWHHVHLDIAGSEGAAMLRILLDVPLPAKIEIGVEAKGDQTPPADLLALLCRHRARILRLLVYGTGTSLPAAAAVERWRQALKTSTDAQIPLLAATRGYFVELNRGIPLDTPVSGIAFPLTATVHSDDAATITENVMTVRDMAETARRLTRLHDLVIAPLALYYPASANPQKFPQQLVAPWLAASLIHVAAARIGSITLADDVVRAIHRLGGGGSGLLARLLDCAAFEVLPLDADLPPDLHAVLLRQAGGAPSRLFAANLGPEPAVLRIAGMDLGAAKAIDGITGAALPAHDAGIAVPGHGVAWIELTA